MLTALGPGLIAANAGNDAGGIATYASAGSQFGYRTLFVMVLVTVALVVVQEMSARLGAHTGEGLVSLFREHFPLRAGAFAVLMLLIANLGLVVSEFAGIGAAFELLGVSRYVAVPIAAVAIWAVVVFGSYRYAERLFLLLTLAFLAYPLAMLLGHPDWRAVGSNLVIPHLLGSKEFLLLAVALIGTTITPYMQLYQAAAVADRGIGPDDYPAERVDTIFGSIFCNVISITIIVATAAAIGGSGPLDSAAQAAQALGPSPDRRPPSCSRSACSAPRRWPPQSCRCRRPTRWPRPSAWSGRCRAASARLRSSSACSPVWSLSAAASRSPRAT